MLCWERRAVTVRLSSGVNLLRVNGAPITRWEHVAGVTGPLPYSPKKVGSTSHFISIVHKISGVLCLSTTSDSESCFHWICQMSGLSPLSSPALLGGKPHGGTPAPSTYTSHCVCLCLTVFLSLPLFLTYTHTHMLPYVIHTHTYTSMHTYISMHTCTHTLTYAHHSEDAYACVHNTLGWRFRQTARGRSYPLTWSPPSENTGCSLCIKSLWAPHQQGHCDS